MTINIDMDMAIDEPSEIDMAVTQSADTIDFELGAEAIAIKNHAVLENRDRADQHPISAITGLADKLSTIPTKTSQLANDSGYITASDIPTVPTKTSQLQNDSGYITSSAIPTVPTKTSQLTNDSGYITSADIPSVPVQSVNGKTGAVSLTASDVGALPSSTTIPTKTSQLTNDSGYITDAGVTSFNGSTGAVTYTAPVTSVNGQTGAVTVTEGLAPLIGTTSTVTATEVKMAVEEGRDVCISYTHYIYGVLEFTSFNVANSIHSVVSHTIVNYNSTILCVELIGVMLSEDTQEMWLCTVDTLASSSDIPTKTSDLTNDSGYITGAQVPSNETDPTVPSWAKASTKPSYTASEVGALPDDTFIPTKTSDLINDSDFMSGMTILLYGHSTWQDFITAYTKKHVVYCRASSQSNPATGSQTRLAFMAYVNNADSPTEVEFQYYRSVSTHTASQQGDQVYVYKLTSAGTWTVTVREASVKVAAGTGITGTYSRDTMTLALDGTLPTKTSDLTNDSGYITLADLPIYDGTVN